MEILAEPIVIDLILVTGRHFTALGLVRQPLLFSVRRMPVTCTLCNRRRPVPLSLNTYSKLQSPENREKPPPTYNL